MGNKELSIKDKKSPHKIRTFIALQLPDHVINKLAAVQRSLKKQALRVKWARPENIHLTLKFLGDIDPDDVAKVCRALETVVCKSGPITLCSQGVGVFPNIRRPRVLWTGIGGQTDLLEKLHAAIDMELGDLGFAREDRRFRGHLTIGRFKGFQDSDEIIHMIKAYANMASDEFIVDAVHVFQSDLKPTGPVYTKLSSIRLGDSGSLIDL